MDSTADTSQMSASLKLIAVMGLTGTGKTTFINNVSGSDLETSDSLHSCTEDIQCSYFTIDDHQVCLIDSPGFDDTKLNDSEILTRIATYLAGLSEQKRELTGLLYLYNINNVRVGQSASRNIRTFRGLVGKTNMRNVVLVTTRWPETDDGEDKIRENRVKELESEDGFWGSMMKAGARHEKLRNTKEDGIRVIRSLLMKDTVELQLQSELRQGKSLIDTTAGQTVNEEMENLKAAHAKELALVKKDLEQAKKEGDHQDAAMLEKERQKLEQQLEASQKAIIALKDAEIDRLRAAQSESSGGGGCVIL
ncbi:P-loop containing nucleoside triphosphate hydrolase protein [Nemania sp. FL0916]|nr:P-loop containing nucleoside triphosphate hydrolase protein [Nemania sp. FL0916]